MNRVLCSPAIVACFVSFALADIPPPPPEPGMKRVPVEHIVKLAEEIPGYKFYTYRGGVSGGESIGEELKLEKGKGVVVPSSSSPSLRTGVLAVPVKVAEELKTNEKLAELTSWKNKDKLPAGVVLHSTRGTIEDLKANDPRKKVEIVTTISTDEKAGVKFTVEAPAAAADKKSSSDASPPRSTMFAGIALAGAMMTGGLWFWRRKETA